MREQEINGVINESPNKAICVCCGRSYSVKQLIKRALSTQALNRMMYVQWRCKKGTMNFTAFPIANRRKM